MAETEIDGVIKDARIVPWGERELCMGAIYEDRKGRFTDGERIRTSYIVNGPDEEGIIRTRNSVYRIEKAA